MPEAIFIQRFLFKWGQIQAIVESVGLSMFEDALHHPEIPELEREQERLGYYEAMPPLELTELELESLLLRGLLVKNVEEVQYGLKLMQDMKRSGVSSGGFGLGDLTKAYDNIIRTLDDEDEIKFLNGGFADLSRFHFTRNAESYFRTNIENESFNPHADSEAAELLKRMIADAEDRSAVFADAFLKNYGEHGLDALGMALSLLERPVA